MVGSALQHAQQSAMACRKSSFGEQYIVGFSGSILSYTHRCAAVLVSKHYGDIARREHVASNSDLVDQWNPSIQVYAICTRSRFCSDSIVNAWYDGAMGIDSLIRVLTVSLCFESSNTYEVVVQARCLPTRHYKSRMLYELC